MQILLRFAIQRPRVLTSSPSSPSFPSFPRHASLRRVTCQRYTGGITATHGYLIEAPGGHLLIDAPEGVADWLAARGIVPVALLLTHQHFDHVSDAARLQAQGVVIHARDPFAPGLTLEAYVRSCGWPVQVPPFRVDHVLAGRSDLALAGLQFALLPVPGHSPDSVAFYLAESGSLFAGDTLMAGTIGRTDLPGGDHDTLIQSIQDQLLRLPGTTRVLAGHGSATTIGAEAPGFARWKAD